MIHAAVSTTTMKRQLEDMDHSLNPGQGFKQAPSSAVERDKILLLDDPVQNDLPPDVTEAVMQAYAAFLQLGRRRHERLNWKKDWYKKLLVHESSILDWIICSTHLQNIDSAISFDAIYDNFMEIIILMVEGSDVLQALHALQNQLVNIPSRYCNDVHRNILGLASEDEDNILDEDHSGDYQVSEESQDAMDHAEDQTKDWMVECRDLLHKTFFEKPEPFADWSFKEVENNLVTKVLAPALKVPKAMYQQPTWIPSLKESGLATILCELSSPDYIPQHPGRKHQGDLIRRHALQDWAAQILERWTPKAEIVKWDDEIALNRPTSEYQSLPSTKHKTKINGAKFITAISKYNIIQLDVYPLSALCLNSLASFMAYWNKMLAPGLSQAGYKWYLITPEHLYQLICNEISKSNFFTELEKRDNYDSRMFKILQRTKEYKDLDKEMSQNSPLFSHRRSCKSKKGKSAKNSVQDADFDKELLKEAEKGQCEHCQGDNVKKCVETQVFKFCSLNELPEDIIGSGISLVPDDEQMTPIRPRPKKNKQGKVKPVPPVTRVYSPDELDLEITEADEEVISCCSRHIILLKEEMDPQGDIKAFIAFNAYAETRYKRMIVHSRRAALLNKINRHHMWWGAGIMEGFGDRVPAAGVKVDGLRPYEGIRAKTLDDIDIIFDHAEDAHAMEEVAHAVHPTMLKDLINASEDCTSIGRSGATLYRCDGYIAPQHLEQDATVSLCSQLEWGGNPDYCEWGFALPQYGFYIRTRSNMVWSFDSRHVHGTILPSQKTLINLRPRRHHSDPDDEANPNLSANSSTGSTCSTGRHDAVQKKDAKKAKVNASVRRRYNLHTKFFST
ncbi:hypothetical protein C8J56DRAFT_1069412 [Mycena floridula]|nr:hypothetical protein C8J56DRAFT_1069412 [Mycena floridula]